jgi:hypothetical protein
MLDDRRLRGDESRKGAVRGPNDKGFPMGLVHGTPGEVASPLCLKSETPRQAGAGWGTLRFYRGSEGLWIFVQCDTEGVGVALRGL